MSTGELIYLIDDNGGSEIFIEFIFTVLMTSQDVFITWWWRHWIVNVIREMKKFRSRIREMKKFRSRIRENRKICAWIREFCIFVYSDS